MYANFTDAMVKTDNTNKRNVVAGNYQLVTDDIGLDILVLADGDLWVNNTGSEVKAGDTIVPAKGTAKTETGSASAEIIFLPDGTRRYVNHSTSPLSVNGVNVQAMCWAADSSETGEAPLPDETGAVVYYNLSGEDVTFGDVTVPAGQAVLPEPEPPAEGPPGQETAEEEGGNGT